MDPLTTIHDFVLNESKIGWQSSVDIVCSSYCQEKPLEVKNNIK